MELPRTKLKILGLIFKVATNLTEVWRNKRILSLNVSFPVSEIKLSGEFKTAVATRDCEFFPVLYFFMFCVA